MASRALPPALHRADVLGGEVAHDLGGAADVAPVDAGGAAVVPFVPGAEAVGELLADRLVVWRDDDEDGIALAPDARLGRLAEDERQRDHDHGREYYAKDASLHSVTMPAVRGFAMAVRS